MNVAIVAGKPAFHRHLQRELQQHCFRADFRSFYTAEMFFRIMKYRKFDLVFLDPPYAYSAEDVAAFVQALDDAGALSDGAIVHYEHAKKDTVHPCPFLREKGLIPGGK
jgi:16S rRNA G966 N2-methylase RsmD